MQTKEWIRQEVRSACAMMIDAEADDAQGFIWMTAREAKRNLAGTTTLTDEEQGLVIAEVSKICEEILSRDQSVELLENHAYNGKGQEGNPDGSR